MVVCGDLQHICGAGVSASGGQDTCRYAWFRRGMGHGSAVRDQNLCLLDGADPGPRYGHQMPREIAIEELRDGRVRSSPPCGPASS
jgi:hypothetical protein